MKKSLIYGLSALTLVASTMSLTSCIEETEPTRSATTSQVQQSSSATEALLMAIPAYSTASYFSSRNDWAFGYGALMYIRDIQSSDVCATDDAGYYQFSYFAENKYAGRDYVFAQYLYNYQTKFVNTTNNVISAVNPENATDIQKGYLGAAYAYRALLYLDMAREYEYLPTDGTEPKSPYGNDVAGLTIPIVTEKTTEAEARDNKRVTREEMKEFIKSDLDKAAEYIPMLDKTTKTLPHLDCVYGLYARLYMWVEDYANAEKYARMAINEYKGKPMTQEESLNTTTGFNDLSKWMWGAQDTKESLWSNLANWASMVSNETSYGYAGGGGCNNMLDRRLYERLSNTDWRKLEWKAPAGSALDGQNMYVDDALGKSLADYSGLKFRPNGGVAAPFSVASATAFPMMRVEEMYLIEAEAAAHQDPARGKQLLESFVKTYRDASYTCKVSDKDAVVEEIVFHKRIELWGEGQSFFDLKRLNYSSTRGYEGTNHLDQQRFNSNGRPAWMNWVISANEEEGNVQVKEYNNPDPSDKYTPWTGK